MNLLSSVLTETCDDAGAKKSTRTTSPLLVGGCDAGANNLVCVVSDSCVFSFSTVDDILVTFFLRVCTLVSMMSNN